MNELQSGILDVLVELDKICQKHDIQYSLYAGTFLGAVRHKGFIPWDDDIDIVLDRNNYNRLISVLSDPHNIPKDYYFQSYETSKNYFNTTPKFRSRKMNISEKMPKHFKSDFGPWVDLFVWDNVPSEERDRQRYYKKLARLDSLIMTFILAQASPNDTGLKGVIKKTLQKTNALLFPVYFFVKPLMKHRLTIMQKYNNVETTHKAVNGYNFYHNYDEYKGNTIKSAYLNDFDTYDFEGHQFIAYNQYDDILTSFYGDYMTLPDEADRVVHNIQY